MSTRKPPGTVYLVHFSRPYEHARRCTETADLDARLAEHAAGRGARLLQVAKDGGITWTLARTWPGAGRVHGRSRTRAGAAGTAPNAASGRAVREVPRCWTG